MERFVILVDTKYQVYSNICTCLLESSMMHKQQKHYQTKSTFPLFNFVPES